MDTDALRKALKNADLKKYEAAAYLTLIEHGELAAVDVSGKSKIPTSQVYDTLRSLEDRGLVETIDGERLRAKPRDPEVMLDELRSRGSLLTNAADALEERWEEPEYDEHRVGVVKRPETVYERTRNQLKEANLTAEFTMSFEQLELLLPELKDAADRGVFVRIHLYAEPNLQQKAAGLGIEETDLHIRVGTIPGPFLSIIDRHWLFFTPNTRADEDYGVLINDYILSFITHWYFVSCQWHMWEPLFDPDDSWTQYDSLEEFMRDTIPLFDDGAEITVEIHGNYIQSREDCLIQGQLTGAFYPSRFGSNRKHLALEDLSSYATVYLDTGEQTLSVGSWGAVYEDVEAHRIKIESIEFPLDPATPETDAVGWF